MLQDFTEPLGKALCGFTYHLAAEYIADRILDYLRFFFTVVTGQLGEILEAETDCHFVASGGGYQIVNTPKYIVGSSSMMMEDFNCPFLFTSFTIRELYRPRAAE